MYKWTNNRSTSVQSGPLGSSLVNCERLPFFPHIFINCQTLVQDVRLGKLAGETHYMVREVSSSSCKMLRAIEHVLLLVAIDISLILLLTISQLSATANSEVDAELADKRFSGVPYPDRYFLPFFKHPNIRKTFLQKNIVRPWTKILQEPPSLGVAVGSRVELQCVAAGNPPPRIYWFSGTDAERQVHDFITRVREEGNVVPAEWKGLGQLSSTYVIDCVKPEDAGYRYCVSVSNDKVASSQPSLLLVDRSRTEECHNQPTITLHAPWRLVTQGSTVLLPCRVEGQPTPYVSWLDNTGNRIGMSMFARHTVMPNGDLRIKNLKWEDMGEYTCRVQSDNTDKSVVSFVYPFKKHE